MSNNRNPEKIFHSASILLLKEGCYYLFSDLPRVLGITEGEAYGVKGHIMKYFWMKKLNHELSAFPPHAIHTPTTVDGIEKTYQAGVHNFSTVFFRNIILDSPEIKDFSMQDKSWDFYQRLINEEIQRVELEKSINPADICFSWILLYLPNLAIHIKDLIYVLKINNLRPLINLLPKQKNETRKKVDTKTRDAWIMNEYEVLKTGNKNLTTVEISKLIETKLKSDKEMVGAKIVTASRIRRIITENLGSKK
ncbi:MAG: hypothetical protein V4482_02155 [Pseudomonadota bacterium]